MATAFYLTRDGLGVVYPPASLRVGDGRSVAAGALEFHECDNPRVREDRGRCRDPQQHVVSGSQGDNMELMARMRRGGGRHWPADNVAVEAGDLGGAQLPIHDQLARASHDRCA